ncbi:MAG: hypothetical protein EOP11_04275 [Proteobacteria bacterium]|nr:MAG: hypothetical protein EOP11_04275 [Pseudomonadota bacterium]
MQLEHDQKHRYQAALKAEEAPWIAFGLDASVELISDRLSGMAGLIDWALHGQVGKLLGAESAKAFEFALLPAPSGHQSFLLYQYGREPDAKAFAAQLKKLGVEELVLAASTFPRDFLAKLEQNLKKDGIPTRHLEP